MCFLSVFLTLLCLKTLTAQNCPPAEDVNPCLCFGSANNIQAHCVGLLTLDQLRNSMKGFEGIRLDTFTIDKSILEYLPHDIFKNVTIHHLKISKTKLARIGNMGEPQFRGLESSLESLTITETFTEKNPFTFVFMDHLKSLKTLELRKNHLEVLHNEWFKKGPESLEVVRFVQCKIQRIGYKALKALSNLKIVDISDNEINYISRTVLPQTALFLEEIHLERNKLENLPKDFFDEMPSLKKVNLELNDFSAIDQLTWGAVWSQIQSLNIDYNPLICDAKIKWIYESKDALDDKIIATCYKPFTLMDRELHSLKIEELK